MFLRSKECKNRTNEKFQFTSRPVWGSRPKVDLKTASMIYEVGRFQEYWSFLERPAADLDVDVNR